jgi:signal transduction histidine kinase
MAWLTYTDTQGAPADFPLDRERTCIGRNSENDLVLPDPTVSRLHATVLHREGRHILVDQKSSLGVVVNGNPVREHHLEDGDRILLGRQALCFRDPASLPELVEAASQDDSQTDTFSWHPNLQPLQQGVHELDAALKEAGVGPGPQLEQVSRGLQRLEEDLGRTRHQHEILRTLLRVSRLVHSVSDPDQLLSLVVGLAVKVLAADRGFLMIREAEGEALSVGASHNMNPEEHSSGSVSYGIANQVLDDGKPLQSDDAVADPRFSARRSVLDLGIRSVLCAPLRCRGGPCRGVLYVDRLASDVPFAPEDLESLSGLANVAAVAIENARLHQEGARRIRAEEELRQAREIEVMKTDFLSMVSHDLRTPLTSIKSWTEILQDDWERIPSEERHRYLGIINQECDRLTRLIDGLLDLQRIESGRMEIVARPCDPEAMLAHAAETFGAAARAKGLDLGVKCEAGLPRVQADPERIAQVLTNLLGNALKFTPSGGKVQLAASLSSRDDRQSPQGRTVTVDLGALETARFVRFSVTDTGEGIPEEMQARIFEKFRQVESAQAGRPKGSGLGLSICREIVERHGGSVGLESQAGRGSTFSFLLPVSRTEVEGHE